MSSLRSPLSWRGLLLALNLVFPVATIGLFVMNDFRAVWMLALTLVIHGLLFWAIMHPRCQWLGPVIHRFETSRKEVWLTLDDGPDGERTRELSAQLKERGVAATFFVIGDRLRAQSETARALQNDGHTLANHTANHPRRSFWCRGRERVSREIDRCAHALGDAGLAGVFFRPPVGHKPPALHRLLAARGLRLISWTTGGRDGWSPDPQTTVRRILRRIKPGAIIVLHESRAHSVPTILAVVDALIAQGYSFTIPSEAALTRGTTVESPQEALATR